MVNSLLIPDQSFCQVRQDLFKLDNRRKELCEDPLYANDLEWVKVQ
jgi:hypothetical protein